MALGLDSIWSSLKDGVAAINNLNTTVKSIFPQLSGNSTVAPSSAGAITFTSSQAVGFQLVVLSSGVTVKFPYYNQ
jgi:hypothetical protein